MATIRAYTTIEQSEKLLELGLDPSTADMYYWCGSADLVIIGGYKAREADLDIPAWSLSALLELMPNEILINGYPTQLKIEKSEIGYYTFEYNDLKGHSQCFLSYPLMEGAVKMICWLIEQGYIKTDKV